jgi:fatty-acyl-CoA synthase
MWHRIRLSVRSSPDMPSNTPNDGASPPKSPSLETGGVTLGLGHDVGRWLSHWATRRPGALAWSDDHRRCDYQTANRRVESLARHLADTGVGPGDRVALWLSNRGATLEALFAAARLGAIVLPINARLTPAEVAFQLDDSSPCMLFTEGLWHEAVGEAMRQMSGPPPVCLEVGASPTGEEDLYEEALRAAETKIHAEPLTLRVADAEDPLILMYTSGTTGRPKGALLPYRKALYNSLNAAGFFELRSEDRVLIAAPLFHSLGLQILAIPAIHAGAGLVIQQGFDPIRVWNAVEEEGITYFGGVPTMHQRLLEALEQGTPFSTPPRSLRFAFTAGAAAPVELIRGFDRQGVLMKQGYGQTETSMLTCLDADRAVEKAGSVGRPVEHAVLRLVDPATIEGPVAAWRDVLSGEVGEVVVSGPITMLGYWQRPDATSETLREGWLRTGDLATRDKAGDISLVGRAREMYISGGENVYPAEVEATLVEHPSIAEAAVVAMTDATWGEVGRAHVVALPGKRIDADEVTDWLSSRLARYKQPKTILVEQTLPRTASGKVQKHRLSVR